MEGLGKKLKEARLARGLTLDDAYRMTKIRPNRLEAIENEDFSLFDSLTYSKAAVLIYRKVLEVRAPPRLATPERRRPHPPPPPRRPPRRPPRGSPWGGRRGQGRTRRCARPSRSPRAMRRRSLLRPPPPKDPRPRHARRPRHGQA